MSNPAVFDDHAQSIARRQYMQEGDGDVLGMFRRVANGVALAESPQNRSLWADRFFDLMASKRFCPGGRVLAGAGTQHGNVLNCFVQGATEHHPASFEGILEVAKKLALVTKVGGGNGVNLDPYTSRQLSGARGTVRGFAYLHSSHPDVQDFVQGLMRPPINPDGAKEPITVRNWTRVVYGLISPELAALARRHGVLTVREKPQGTLPIPDDMAGIIEAAQQALRVVEGGLEPHIDFSDLRPEGAPIRGSGGTSSGPVSFLMEIFDNFLEWANLGAEKAGPVATLRYVYSSVLRVVRQGGTRRGAGMATLAIDHPDLLDFLTAKDLDREAAEGDISTFNISILATQAFWETLEANGLWAVEPCEVPGKYYPHPLSEPFDGTLPDLPEREIDGARPIPIYQGKVPARWLWHEIAWHAWATGEPGLIFIDRVNEFSALKEMGPQYQIRSTNPCGEIPLTVGEPCDLGAINLAAYVERPNQGLAGYNLEALRADVRTCTRFLDNVLEVNVFALEDNRTASQNLRRLGLGVMGLADALILMGLPYSSQAGRDAVETLMDAMRHEAIAESEQLGHERGIFPLMAQYPDRFAGITPRRNVAVLTVAPTGTTSMLMGVSSGIEPMFSPFMWRRIGGQYKALLHPLFQQLLEQHPPTSGFTQNGQWDWDALIEAIQANHGSVVGLEGIPQQIGRLFEGAHDVPPLDHVRMQATVQRAFDREGLAANSLSKTINLANSASVADVEAAYSEAYRKGCKGITVYRDGSRDFQVLSVSKEEKKPEASETAAPPAPASTETRPGQPVFERTGRLVGYTDMVKLTGADGTRRGFLVTVNLQGQHPVEVILTSGKAGDEANADSEALGRVISIALQYGVPPEAIVRTMRGINGGLYGNYQGRFVTSKADLIAIALETASPVSQEKPPLPVARTLDGDNLALSTPHNLSLSTPHNLALSTPHNLALSTPHNLSLSTPPSAVAHQSGAGRCPECGDQNLVREEGCVKCYSCGYSKCG